MSDFAEWFRQLTKYPLPHGWQEELATSDECRPRLVRIPTGLGKTEAVLTAWSYHRIHRNDDRWPRRLVWCLPMRVLVEQTEQVAREIADRVDQENRPGVHVVMGGEDAREWFLKPERPAVIIGTQDMLLSRALNRGYASMRARWPTEFGLLSQDALWVMDEVQLMDVGLATSAQLQAFRDQDSTKHLRPCVTWWMSATLQPDWLRSVDTERWHKTWVESPCVVPPPQRKGNLWEIQKSLGTGSIPSDNPEAFATRVLAEHAALPDGDYGRITLVVCNTVDRACETFEALKIAGRTEGLELVHSRFRPAERSKWRDRFLSRESCVAGVDRIIVATQVVEAGVNISAGCLITELAPWPSLVQRFGRCARYGGSGSVVVVDRWSPKQTDDERSDTSSAPYESDELQAAWDALHGIKDVGVSSLEVYEASLTPEARGRLYPYSPKHLIMRHEFDELFDTTADLTGADLDISRFIRSGNERDLQVFWIDLANDQPPPDKRHARREELCPVPFLRARDWLCGPETKEKRKPRLRGGMRAWVWDWIEGEWAKATRASLLPGRVVCVAAACGGYRVDHGFDSESKESVLTVAALPVPQEVRALTEADAEQDGEQVSYSHWKTIAFHTQEVTDEVKRIAVQVGLSDNLQHSLELAAWWHDWGKSHPAFQGALKPGPERPHRVDLAKGPEDAWRDPRDMYRYLDGSESRPTFRHELASALGLFSLLELYAPQHPALLGSWSGVLEALGKAPASVQSVSPASPLVQRLLDCSAEEFDLVAYLVASHHGKVRSALHASPKDQEYRDRDGNGLPIRGVREMDRLPSIVLVAGEAALPEVALTLSPAAIGLSERTGASWRERSESVLERFGPGALAFLEAILRAADVHASRLKTNDPLLAKEVEA